MRLVYNFSDSARTMAFQLNLQTAYEVAQPVRFWASLDPGDAPLLLPNANPYQILRMGQIVFQPVSPSGKVRLTHLVPLDWTWNQKTQGGQAVPEGTYSLRFFATQSVTKDFSITSNTPNLIKGIATPLKWAFQLAAPVLTLFHGELGAAMGVAAVALDWIHNDPPRGDVTEFSTPYLVSTRDMRILRKNLTISTYDEVITEALNFASALFCILTTLERLQGAKQHDNLHYANLQLQHLRTTVDAAKRFSSRFSQHIKRIEKILSDRPVGALASPSLSSIASSVDNFTENYDALLKNILTASNIDLMSGNTLLREELLHHFSHTERTYPSVQLSPLTELLWSLERFDQTFPPPAAASPAEASG